MYSFAGFLEYTCDLCSLKDRSWYAINTLNIRSFESKCCCSTISPLHVTHSVVSSTVTIPNTLKALVAIGNI